MNAHPSAGRFAGIAALISQGVAPERVPVNLADVLANAAGGINANAREERAIPSADDVRGKLERVGEAARFLATMLEDPSVLDRLDRAEIGDHGRPVPSDTWSVRPDGLRNLSSRARAALGQIQVSPGVEVWPKPEAVKAAEGCAIVILSLWRAVRGRARQRGDGTAQQRACNAMWEACGQDAPGQDLRPWVRRLELAQAILDDPTASEGERPNSPEAVFRRQVVMTCKRLTAGLVPPAEQAERERRQRVIEANAARRAHEG